MARNLLPRLRQAPNPANVELARVGDWTDVQTPAELGKLDFGVTPGDDVRQRVQSIPSPWARMLLFRAAMDDPGHPARRLVENELLDAFEFLWSRNERPNAPLVPTTLRVDEIEAMARSAGTERAEWVGRALLELLPQRSADGGGGATRAFEAITIISVGGRPVLGTSPYTLLFTAEDAATLPVRETGAYFRYATGGEARTLAQRPFAFQRFVAQVLLPQLDQLGNSVAGNTDGPTAQRLLKRWLADQVERCRRNAGDAGDAVRQAQLEAPGTPGPDRAIAAAATLKLTRIDGITGRVAWFARTAGDEMSESRWLLRPGRTSGGQAPVIVHREQFDGRFVPNGPPVSLPSALDAQSRELLPGTATRYPWVSPIDDWFADQLLVLAAPLRAGWERGAPPSAAQAGVYGFAGAGGFTSQYGGPEAHLRAPQFALPFKREVLRYFAPEELERRVSIVVEPTGHVLVTLRLPIGTGTEDLAVERRYTESMIASARGPELALWPNFRSERWRDYVLFQRDVDGQPWRPFTVRAVTGGEALDDTSITERRGDSVYLTWCDSAPDAFEFIDAITAAGVPRRLGLVLPRYASVETSTEDEWHVGVDFGTSNTVVSRRVGGEGAPQIFGIPNLTLHLTQLGAEATRAAEAYFFPDALDAAPFGTAVLRRLLLQSNDLDREPVALRINVPFTGRVVADERNAVVGDLKWSTDRERRFLSEAYLRHVLSTLFADAIRHGVDPANVSVVWSYPRAFLPTQQSQFAGLWNRVLTHLRARLVSPGARAATPDGALTSVDESRAVLRYFFNAGRIATAGRANVVIDVGGGTSDIAIYGGGRTLALDSVMLGGRNLTGQRLQAGTFDQLQNPFVRRFVEWSRRHGIGDHETVEARAVNTYLRDGQDHLAFGYLLRSRWFETTGTAFSGNAASHAFQGLVVYFFGALFHHVGLTLRAVREAQPDLAPDALVPSLVILAGNGSRYVDWLTNAFGTMRPNAEALRPFSQLFSGLLMNAMGGGATVAGPDVQLSPHPKLEVALGLVHQKEAPGAAEPITPRSPALGEAIRVEVGDAHVPSTFTATSRMDPGQLVRVESLPSLVWTADELEITRFHAAFREALRPLAAYGAHWTTLGRRFQTLLDALDRPTLEDAARARLEYLASANEGFQGSLFLLEVTTVLDRMLDTWFDDHAAPATPGGARQPVASP